jgi:hypothetical protein
MDNYVMEVFDLDIDIKKYSLYLQDYYNMEDSIAKKAIACGLSKMCYVLNMPFILDDMDQLIESEAGDEYEDDEIMTKEQKQIQRLNELETLKVIKNEIKPVQDADMKEIELAYTTMKDYKNINHNLTRWLRAIQECLDIKLDFNDLYPPHFDDDTYYENNLTMKVTLNRNGALEAEHRYDVEQILNNYSMVDPCYVVYHHHNSSTSNIARTHSLLNTLFSFNISEVLKPKEEE